MRLTETRAQLKWISCTFRLLDLTSEFDFHFASNNATESRVNWGNKLIRQCLSRKIIVARMDYSDADHTPCLAWQRPVGN